jgi:hypothetical protein
MELMGHCSQDSEKFIDGERWCSEEMMMGVVCLEIVDGL